MTLAVALYLAVGACWALAGYHQNRDTVRANCQRLTYFRGGLYAGLITAAAAVAVALTWPRLLVKALTGGAASARGHEAAPQPAHTI